MDYSQETYRPTRENFGENFGEDFGKDPTSGSDDPITKTKTDGVSGSTRTRVSLVIRLQSQSPKSNKTKALPTSSPSQYTHNYHLPRVYKRAARRLSETPSARSSSRETKAQEENRCKAQLLEERKDKQAREKRARMEKRNADKEKKEEEQNQTGPSNAGAGAGAEKRKRPSANSTRGQKPRKPKPKGQD